MILFRTQQSWVLAIIMQAAIIIYLIFILVYMSLTSRCSADASGVNITTSEVKFGENGFDTGLVTLAAAFLLYAVIFATCLVLNKRKCMTGSLELAEVGVVISGTYFLVCLLVLVPLLALQLTRQLRRLATGECFHEWHIGTIVLASFSLVTLVVTITVPLCRRSDSTHIASRPNNAEEINGDPATSSMHIDSPTEMQHIKEENEKHDTPMSSRNHSRGLWKCKCGNITLITNPSIITPADITQLGVKANTHDFFKGTVAEVDLENTEINKPQQVKQQAVPDWSITCCLDCHTYTHAVRQTRKLVLVNTEIREAQSIYM